MKVLFDEKGYIDSFTINEENDFGDFEAQAVILPDPEDLDHFVDNYMHYNKDGFDKAHYDACLSKEEFQVRIDELKAQLSASDYKVIKCMEAQLSGEEMPYDIQEIHAERQAIRDQINELEQ